MGQNCHRKEKLYLKLEFKLPYVTGPIRYTDIFHRLVNCVTAAATLPLTQVLLPPLLLSGSRPTTKDNELLEG